MKLYKLLIYILTLTLFFNAVTGVNLNKKYNENGDFTIEIDSLKKTVFNEDIIANFQIQIENNKNYNQKQVDSN